MSAYGFNKISFFFSDDMPGAVSENELMKAEDIQPNEMKGIDSFLKDSNHVEKPNQAMINDCKFVHSHHTMSEQRLHNVVLTSCWVVVITLCKHFR